MKKNDQSLFYKPWSELKSIQNTQLRKFVSEQLYPYSDFYQKLFKENNIDPRSIRTRDDLRRIPFTDKKSFIAKEGEDQTEKNLSFLLKPTKEKIKQYLPLQQKLKLAATKIFRGEQALTDKLEAEYYPIFLTATTGTTQQPVSFLYTPYDLENLKLYGYRLMHTFGFKRGEKVVNIFPYAPHLAFWQVFYGGIATNTFIMSTGGGKTMGTEGNIKTIEKIRPQFIMGVPNYIYHLLKVASDKGCDFSSVHSVVLGAGRVPPGLKQKIATLLVGMGAKDIKVFGTYGFTEARCAWGESPTALQESSGYHTYPDQEIFEIIDPKTGEVKGEGEDGEIVYSKISGRGTCVFRYRTGDLVRGGITYTPCPFSGRTAPRISNDIYRASNMKSLQLTKIKGTLVDLNHLELTLDGHPDVTEWQIEVCKKDNDPFDMDELNLNVSLMKNVDPNLFKKIIKEELLAKTEVRFNKINVLSTEQIQDLIGIESQVKALKIVDKRPKD